MQSFGITASQETDVSSNPFPVPPPLETGLAACQFTNNMSAVTSYIKAVIWEVFMLKW